MFYKSTEPQLAKVEETPKNKRKVHRATPRGLTSLVSLLAATFNEQKCQILSQERFHLGGSGE